MDAKVIEIIGAQGAWALLSIVLIFYILKAQEKKRWSTRKKRT